MENKKKRSAVRADTASPAEAPAATAEPASQEAKRLPVKTIREGNVSASIWSRETLVQMERRTFYSVTLERSYKVSGQPWKYTKSFDASDLPNVAKVAQQAEEFILQLRQQEAD